MPNEDHFGPRTPRGMCPLCLSPEINGGMRAGSSIPFECGTHATPTGRDAFGVFYRDAYNISVGQECRKNIVAFREFFYEGRLP